MRITFATYRLDRETFTHPPKRLAPRWLYRLFKKAYAWLGDFVNEPVEASIKTTTIDFTKKFDAIRQHKYEIERTTGLRPKYLFIGREAYFELTNEQMNDYPFLLPMNLSGPPETTVLGLTVVVVPWIEGMFCLPDLDRLIR